MMAVTIEATRTYHPSTPPIGSNGRRKRAVATSAAIIVNITDADKVSDLSAVRGAALVTVPGAGILGASASVSGDSSPDTDACHARIRSASARDWRAILIMERAAPGRRLNVPP